MTTGNKLKLLFLLIILPLLLWWWDRTYEGPVTQLSEELITLGEQLTELRAANLEHPSQELSQKIDRLEQEVVEEVAQHGMKAIVHTHKKDSLEVLESPGPGFYKVLATLVDGDAIQIYECHYKGLFFIATAEGIRGYLLHDNFSPSTQSFPLKILVEKAPDPIVQPIPLPKHPLPEIKVPKEQEDPPAIVSNQERGGGYAPDYEQDSEEPSGPCPTVQCVATTQKGTRCKRSTSECDGHCFQH